MTNDLIQKFVEDKDRTGKAVNIFFKQRNPINGLFIQWKDYDEMKAKNFWRIVSESKIEEWRKAGQEFDKTEGLPWHEKINTYMNEINEDLKIIFQDNGFEKNQYENITNDTYKFMTKELGFTPSSLTFNPKP